AAFCLQNPCDPACGEDTCNDFCEKNPCASACEGSETCVEPNPDPCRDASCEDPSEPTDPAPEDPVEPDPNDPSAPSDARRQVRERHGCSSTEQGSAPWFYLVGGAVLLALRRRKTIVRASSSA